MPIPFFEVPSPFEEISDPPPPAGELSAIPDMINRAVSRLIEYYRRGPRNRSVVGGAVAEVQILEDAIGTLRGAPLDTATGEDLDQIGRLVREPRGSFSDDTSYRVAIRTRIVASASRGRISDLIDISRAIAPNVYPRIRENFPPQITLFCAFTAASPSVLTWAGRILRGAKPAGVRVDLVLGPGEAVIGDLTGVVHGSPMGSADGAVPGFPMHGVY
jgi:hypothetical protein